MNKIRMMIIMSLPVFFQVAITSCGNNRFTNLRTSTNYLKYIFEKMKRHYLILLIALTFFPAMLLAGEYHVSVKGNDSNDGSFSYPFKTISKAALIAQPGDEIIVHTGTYREWINPARGGESDSKRIVYRAAPGEKVQIKGSEVITGWKKEREGVWKVTIPNSFFGTYNPYQDSVYGDWFDRRGRIHHTGEVFLNGKSLYEKETLDKVLNPVANKNIRDTTGSIYTWYCESINNNTIIWANFHEFNPNKELVEISARRTVFYPDKPGLNYITISGFNISQAATQWAAPTAEQIGMISTHWNKGWIIENNVIHDSKCSGITLGKERSTGHNVWSADPSIDGSIYYIEVIFNTLRYGWNKENIGSHIVRNNEIYNCEQTGICGSMGAAFSIIENNHVYNIWTKRQFSGAELAGIKIHAAIDAIVRKNRIHDCGRGYWFDWMAQGTRISGNLFYNNDLEDVFFEVNHGPFLVDNNIFLSPVSIKDISEGGAFVHNLFAGKIILWSENNRFTPYQLPHSTDVSGISTVSSGDDRYYNNIFIGKGQEIKNKDKNKYGLVTYNDSIEIAWCNNCPKRAILLPFWINSNIYYNGAQHFKNEKNFIEKLNYNPNLKLTEENQGIYLRFTLDDSYFNFKTQLITTSFLGKTKLSKEGFENPDGTSLTIDRDYSGYIRTEQNNIPGPFVNLKGDVLTVKVW